MTLVDEFFAEEFNTHVANVLREAIRASKPAFLTFNRFNVRLDPATQRVKIEDELDPASEMDVQLEVFVRRMDASVGGTTS